MKDLTLNYTAIGSLPYKGESAPAEAIKVVFENYKEIPFWPQLPNYSHDEDMVIQYAINMAGLTTDGTKYYFDEESEEFAIALEEFYFDWEIISNAESFEECEETLDKYAISEKSSSTFRLFLEKIKNNPNVKYAKGSVTGAFTTATSISDKEGKCAYYNEILRDIIAKTIALKAIWQIKEIKKANKNITPIIFMDEPSVSQLGSSAFLTIEDNEVLEMFNVVSSLIKKFGGIVGMHCCGKSNWEIPINASVDMINFDSYLYPQSVAIHHKKIQTFLNNGGILAFGIIPTIDDELIQKISEEELIEKFESAVQMFVDKGISKEQIIKHSFITPSCGCGSLSLEGAHKVIYHTKKLSENLKAKYKEILWHQL